MEIVDYGFFRVREPGADEAKILWFENEKGEDWYAIREGITKWDVVGRYISAIFPTWALVDADGYVTNVEYDPSRLMPGDRRVLGIDAPLSSVTVGMKYEDGKLG